MRDLPVELVPVGKLASMLRGLEEPVRRALGALDVEGPAVRERARLCLDAVEAFIQHFGSQAEVLVARSTGRINLVGMHVDHRGGHVNPVAIKDVFFVVEPREDDQVHGCNADKEFPARSFRICDELPRHKIEDWDGWTHDQFEKRRQQGEAGDWINYVTSGVLYLQHLATRPDGAFDPALRGMNLAVAGNIPRAAGLSSSSGIVMGSIEACLAANGLQMEPLEQVEAARLAEWYVGTRGGGGDGAAIKMGRKGQILHIGSFPFTVSSVPLPQGYGIVLANSLAEAKKQEGARDLFNEKVACYELGFLMLKRNFPHRAPHLEHLRDVSPSNLEVPEAEIYRMLLSLPQRADRAELRESLPDDLQELERHFRTHREPEQGYPIRQVIAYGITECIRGEVAAQMLEEERLEEFGELINISHDGDRVSRVVGGERVPVDNSLPDEELRQLIADAESGDHAREEKARLWRQPGGYQVSTPEMDELVDIARAHPGVLGAGLTGAGLGGCVVAVVENQQAESLVEAMATQYYKPRDLPPSAELVRPLEGAGVLDLASRTRH